MGARRFCGLAEVAQQGGRQHVLYQRRFTRTADTGDAHQPLQRNLDIDVLEVVLGNTLQNQPWSVRSHHAIEPHAHLFAPAQISASQRIGTLERLSAAVKNDLSTPLARPRAHVNHAVRRQHHRRVVLHHHQRVACIAQPLHGHNDAVHVTRMQPDAGLVQHKQRVDQRGTERGCEVDTLHLAATEGAALAVQSKVANAHIAKVFQPGTYLFKQQFEGLSFGLIHRAGRQCLSFRQGGITQAQLQGIKKLPQLVQRQQHHVVQTQARQRFELRARPLHTLGHKALRRVQNGVGLLCRANTPQQALGLEPRAAACAAGRVTAVLGQEHANVHLVGLGFEVFKEPVHTKPVLVPLAIPLGRALEHPFLLRFGQLVPGRITRNACRLGVAHQIVLAFLPGGRLHRLDRARAQGQFVVRNDQAIVDAHYPAKAAAGFARAHRRVEGKHGGDGVGIAQITLRAMQTGGEAPVGHAWLLAFVHQHIHIQAPATPLERGFNRL